MELDKIDFDIQALKDHNTSSKESFEISSSIMGKARDIFYGFEEEKKIEAKDAVAEMQKEIDDMGPIVIKSNEEEDKEFRLKKPVIKTFKKDVGGAVNGG